MCPGPPNLGPSMWHLSADAQLYAKRDRERMRLCVLLSLLEGKAEANSACARRLSMGAGGYIHHNDKATCCTTDAYEDMLPCHETIGGTAGADSPEQSKDSEPATAPAPAPAPAAAEMLTNPNIPVPTQASSFCASLPPCSLSDVRVIRRIRWGAQARRPRSAGGRSRGTLAQRHSRRESVWGPNNACASGRGRGRAEEVCVCSHTAA
jgi:hypothetical protein